ncbi:hypothetical protein OROMI_011378 [Orobanche minor]
MNQIEISGSGIGGSVTVGEKKRSSYPLLSGHQKKPRSSDPPPPLSEGQLQKIYDAKKVTVESTEGYYTEGGTQGFVPTGNPTYVFVVVCKVCECTLLAMDSCPSFGEDSKDYDFLHRHAMKHIELGFIDRDGSRLLDEIPVRKGYARVCEYCGCGFKRCGSGAYYAVPHYCGYCGQVGKHQSEECPERDVNVKVGSPCCSP